MSGPPPYTELRTAIAAVASTVPGLVAVHAYEVNDDTSNMPYLTIWRARDTPMTDNVPLGRDEYLVEWLVRVTSSISRLTPQSMTDVQQQHDALGAALLTAYKQAPTLNSALEVVAWPVSVDVEAVPPANVDAAGNPIGPWLMRSELALTTRVTV